MSTTTTRRSLTAEEAQVLANHLALAETAVRTAAEHTFILAMLVHQHLAELPTSWAMLPDGVTPDDNGTSPPAIAERLHEHLAQATGLLDLLGRAVRFEIAPFLRSGQTSP